MFLIGNWQTNVRWAAALWETIAAVEAVIAVSWSSSPQASPPKYIEIVFRKQIAFDEGANALCSQSMLSARILEQGLECRCSMRPVVVSVESNPSSICNAVGGYGISRVGEFNRADLKKKKRKCEEKWYDRFEFSRARRVLPSVMCSYSRSRRSSWRARLSHMLHVAGANSLRYRNEARCAF